MLERTLVVSLFISIAEPRQRDLSLRAISALAHARARAAKNPGSFSRGSNSPRLFDDPRSKSCPTMRPFGPTEGAVMRRRFSGTGCGACGRASQARLREASGHRPPQLRGAALRGLDAAGRARRKPRARAGEEPAVRVRGSTVPSPKSPRWSAERRASGDFRTPRRRKAWTESGAPLGAPPPRAFRGEGNEGAPRALKTGAAECWL